MAKTKQFEAFTKMFVAYKKLGVCYSRPPNTAALETDEKAVGGLKKLLNQRLILWPR